MKKLTVSLLAMFCVVTFAQQRGDFADSRDGKKYKTVKIGTQTWMAENLNYAAESSICYDNKPENCDKYGRLYNWNTAKDACPSDWHLPKDSEWNALIKTAGGNKRAGEHLKAKSGWNSLEWCEEECETISLNGKDTYGFAALPGGSSNTDGSFVGTGGGGYWWSSTESNVNFAWSQGIDNLENEVWNVDRRSSSKSGLLSVRCIQDNQNENNFITGGTKTKARGSIKAPNARDIDMGKDDSRSKAEIMAVVNSRMIGLRNIYNKHLNLKPGFSGKVTLRFTIAPSGDITDISIVSSTTEYPEFDNAIKDMVSTWKWKTIKSGNATATIPFTFE
jgi:TonB family protein